MTVSLNYGTEYRSSHQYFSEEPMTCSYFIVKNDKKCPNQMTD